MGKRHSFWRDERGTVIILFAFLLLPIIGFVGLATDSSRAYIARAELQRALDASALVGGRLLHMDPAERDKAITAFFDENLKESHYWLHGVNLTIIPDTANNTLEVTATGRMHTALMGVLGHAYTDVSATSEIIRGDSSLEIALALDVSESMKSSKMNALKAAARDLVDILYPNGKDEKVQTSIIPWDQIVTLRGVLNRPVAKVG